MKKIFFIFTLVFVFLGSFLFDFNIVFAQAGSPSPAPDILGTEFGADSGLSQGDPRFMVASTIKWALGILGMIALVIFLYSGFEIITSMGSEEKIRDAKKRIWYTVIGMTILLSAYAITRFVFRAVYVATDARIYN